MSFSLQKDKRGVVVVGVDGQLIVGNRQELKQKVLDALDGGARKFVIDFTKTGYIDSSGLGVLVSLSPKIREQEIGRASWRQRTRISVAARAHTRTRHGGAPERSHESRWR